MKQKTYLLMALVLISCGILYATWSGNLIIKMLNPIVSADLSPVTPGSTLTDPSLPSNGANGTTQGTLESFNAQKKPIGLCPLKHTTVKAEISGPITRVSVTQSFQNPFNEKIEAIYTFPLPEHAAVDSMTMKIGKRIIQGKIKEREEARQIYEQARAEGKIASLLDQERPNIFTQSVANIMPGNQIEVELTYVENLKYEDGVYEFVFPMVVGPRYIPGNATSSSLNSRAVNTDRVPDASRITPPVAAPKTRSGHDVYLEVALDAGLPIENMEVPLHNISANQINNHSAFITLKDQSEIPNRDFILRYRVAGKQIQDAIITHKDNQSGYFNLILQPPQKLDVNYVTPKELVFVLDTSGSMEGFPIEKAKESMKMAIDGLNAQDTFNLITFAGDTSILFNKPVPATAENVRKAQAFLETRQGGGGTEMMKAIDAALKPTDNQNHIRIVCFMTDGYVGNEFEIISEIQKHKNARVFSFGIGDSVNRFLLDKMASEGRGEVEYVTLKDDGSAAARRFHERIHNPLLTDISIDWNGMPVTDLYPARIPDLFGAKPVIITGRYNNEGHGTIRLKGKYAGQDFVREIYLDLPQAQPKNSAIAKLWARNRIEDLMNQDYSGLQSNNMRPDIKKAITQTGLDYHLLTQFTSFVAVEKKSSTKAGKPITIDVPVDAPEGTAFAEDEEESGMVGAPPMGSVNGGVVVNKSVAGGVAAGIAGGVLGGVTGDIASLPVPAPPQSEPAADPGPKTQPNPNQKTPPNPTIVRRSEGVIRGTAKSQVKPVYPPLAQNAHVTGDVQIEITISEQGDVIAARVVSGHPLLQQAALTAAKQWKFNTTLLNNNPVKVSGVLTFRFTGANFDRTKLDTNLIKMVESGSADIVTIKVTTNANIKDVIAQLQLLGFQQVGKTNAQNTIIGKLTVTNIGELSLNKDVLHIDITR